MSRLTRHTHSAAPTDQQESHEPPDSQYIKKPPLTLIVAPVM